jgi:putative membrane-bound dehydrogenase-like protein
MSRICTSHKCLIVAIFAAMISIAPFLKAQDSKSDVGRNTLPRQQHNTSNAPFLTPAEAVSKMAIPEGFEVSVFASEPDIAEPIAFCFDDRGRLWVAENFNYRTRREHTDDQVSRIQILEDTNGDGVFDNKKTFSDKLTFTSGLACGFGGVFVGSPPHLSFIPDQDGDDVPDGPPQPLLDGWGINDRHETLNSFIWGPDGWLYGCHGVFTQSNVGHIGDDDSKRQFIDGGIWRYHPIRKTFEIFARGLSNPWGFDFDDHGQGFATCCVIPHLFHVVQGGVYHKQSLPQVNPHIYDDIKTIRDHEHLSAHGGARFYLSDVFPKQYRNQLFMCNIHEHAVLTDMMVPNGSSFIGRHGEDFMPTNDLAWVGFSVEIGPDGGVYILDWHDTDVCGNAINFPNSGRVYRIMPKGAPRKALPNLTAMSDEQLVKLQTHDNDWYVRHARTLLHYRASTGKLNQSAVHAGLNAQLSSATTSAKRLRALWALQVTDGLNEDHLVSLLDNADPYVRAWVIQFLCDASAVNAFQDASQANQATVASSVLKKFAGMAKEDPSPIVRLYLASAVQRMPFADRWPILEELASHAEDINDNNLPRMIWFSLEPMVPNHARQALNLAIHGKLPNLQEFVARRMVSGDAVPNVDLGGKPKQDPKWQSLIAKVAPGFTVHNVGEGGVVYHDVFRNSPAVQTHPLDQSMPSSLVREFKVPENKTTRLALRVSHHPHGDWQLRVRVGDQLLAEKIIGAKSVGEDEWLETSVDLTKYAGSKIKLSIENRANDWNNEWAYWNRVSIISE